MLPVIIKRNRFPYRDEFISRDILSSFFNDGADYSVPAVNIKESENNFEIDLAAPGLKKEDFQIKLEKNILTISSKKEVEKNENEPNFMRKEFSFGSFCRSFSLPESVDSENIKASHENGILKLELPKFDKAKVKAIKEIMIS